MKQECADSSGLLVKSYLSNGKCLRPTQSMLVSNRFYNWVSLVSEESNKKVSKTSLILTHSSFVLMVFSILFKGYIVHLVGYLAEIDAQEKKDFHNISPAQINQKYLAQRLRNLFLNSVLCLWMQK